MKPSVNICNEIRCKWLRLGSPRRCGVTGNVPGHMETCPRNKINTYDELIETLAVYEHSQWVEWSKALARSEPLLSPERIERWKKLWVPYHRLSEDQKESDRHYARKVLKTLIKEGYIRSVVILPEDRGGAEK